MSNLPKLHIVASSQDIVDNAKAAGTFSKMFSALKAADLVSIFRGASPFTILAPTGDAFRKLPDGVFDRRLTDKAKLTAIIKLHVLPSKVPANGKMSHQSKSTHGNRLQVGNHHGQITVDHATVTTGGIKNRNGVLYGIDTVFMPA